MQDFELTIKIGKCYFKVPLYFIYFASANNNIRSMQTNPDNRTG